jgi:hypothetical protein
MLLKKDMKTKSLMDINITKVFYNKERDMLVDDNRYGFGFAFGVVKLK